MTRPADPGPRCLSLGLDIGSVNAHAALLGADGKVKLACRVPIKGSPLEALKTALASIAPATQGEPVRVGATGTGRDLFGPASGACLVNEIVACALGARKLAPRARSLMEIGGHLSKFVLLDETGAIQDYSLNELCAAGSGAFFEQQAQRLGVPATELGAIAFRAAKGAAVAGRCSVFAKSDMIHLQQKGTPLEEIAYGLCLAVARNFASTVVKGRALTPPVTLIGGCAENAGLRRALREVFGVEEKDLLVPEHHGFFGAVGAALFAAAQGGAPSSLERLCRGAGKQAARGAENLAPLRPAPRQGASTEEASSPPPAGTAAFLGLDVGSVSTDLALIGEDGAVLDGVYLATRGQPLEAVQEGLARLQSRADGRVKILGVVTTGSGRHLAARYLRADAAVNEITAQFKSSVFYLPETDTIFEIGGQDSKYISLKNGALRDFAMNKICAAGTGSFLEEQAVRLGLSIIGEFSEKALQSAAPADFGSQCTVFMDTELVHAVRRGAPVQDLAAGLAYSVARNYLEKVVGNRPVGKNIVFQGGVASNEAVVSAFSN
ncbi:MAG: acyl-CoA dehydratase activase, partial [Elusimicrobia bacterium]|nr:acyl-CoA dehydratase activase [Elusimicrobiota bacterium]